MGGVGYTNGQVLSPSEIVESLAHNDPATVYIRYRVRLTDLNCGTQINRNIKVGILPKPAITCPAAMTVGTSSDGNGDCSGGATFTHPTNANASCAPNSLTMSIDNSPNPLSVVQGDSYTATFTEGNHTVDYVLTDGNGNTDMCTLNITVDDDDPTANCKPASVTLDGNGSASIAPAGIEDGPTDNCGIDPNGSGLDKSTFNCNDVPSAQVELTVTDVNGRTATCQATVTVTDNEDPGAKCKNATVALDASGNGSITTADVDDGSTDNCGIDPNGSSLSQSAFGCGDVGTVSVTLTVTDVNGNTGDCTADITANDDEDPEAKCKPLATDLDPDGTYTLDPAAIDDGSSDACGNVTLSVSPSQFDCNDEGATRSPSPPPM